MEPVLESIISYIQSGNLMVLSNNTEDGYPNSSLLFYIAEQDKQDRSLELFIMTSPGSSKYKDISRDNKVCFVIGTEMEPITVQGRAIATELTDNSKRAEKLDILLKRAEKHADFWPPIMSISENAPVVLKLSVKNLKGFDSRNVVENEDFKDNHQFFFELGE